jgi:hypothetical protein
MFRTYPSHGEHKLASWIRIGEPCHISEAGEGRSLAILTLATPLRNSVRQILYWAPFSFLLQLKGNALLAYGNGICRWFVDELI